MDAYAPPYPGNRLILFPFSFLAAPSAGAVSGKGATDASTPGTPVLGGFSFSVPARSLFLRRTPPRPNQQ